MRDDKYIARKFGRDHHFRVPDGYFNNLAASLMDNLPERQSPRKTVMSAKRNTLNKRWRPLAIAACICAAVGGTVVLLNNSRPAATTIHDDTALYFSQDIETDMMADYAMLTSDDFYRYMSEE